MTRKISVMCILTLLFTLFVSQVCLAETSDYDTLSGGAKVQWFTSAEVLNGTRTFTWPTAFANKYYSVVVTQNRKLTPATAYFEVNSQTTTGCSITAQSGFTNTTWVNVIAVGD